MRSDLAQRSDIEMPAPDFKLPLVALNSAGEQFELTKTFVSLQDSIGKGRPVMLVFGSFT